MATMRYFPHVVALVACAACGPRCPDPGFTAGSFSIALDSHSPVAGPPCEGVDVLAVGMSVAAHFDTSGNLAASCETWIDRCAGLSSPTAFTTGALGDGLAHGEYPMVLASSCSGTWEVMLMDFDPSSSLGTTPVTSSRAYFFHRVFVPDDTGTCHDQFGAFESGTAVCRDTWASHLVPSGI